MILTRVRTRTEHTLQIFFTKPWICHRNSLFLIESIDFVSLFSYTVCMKNISRSYNITEKVEPGKVLVIYGPRRVGKTTLVQSYTQTLDIPVLNLTGDDIFARNMLSSESLETISNAIAGYSLIVVDEAQQIPNIGIGLKLIVDHHPRVTIIATGSLSFDLANKIGEPLVGRKNTLTLYPVSVYELLANFPRSEVSRMRGSLLVTGAYPSILTETDSWKREARLREQVSSYLLKDLLSLEQIRSPQKLVDLLRLLAYQIGQPVSLNSLANELDLDIKTVARYLDLLEKTFVIFRIQAYSRNIGNTIKQKCKYFFWDLGVRNTLINNFSPLLERNDIGALWENFCFIERIKRNTYIGDRTPNYYFYQSYTGLEIDIIEEYNGYTAFECKWKQVKAHTPIEWQKSYPDSPLTVIHQENFLDILGK